VPGPPIGRDRRRAEAERVAACPAPDEIEAETLSVELRHLRYYVAVVEEGQISAAARRLHLAQPALTQAIQALEQAVGVRLLDRHPRGVTPTAAGTRMFAGAKATIATAEQAVALARDEGPERRVVRVGAIPAAPRLGEISRAFRAAHPDVALLWQPLDFLNDATAVPEGEVDVAFLLPAYRAREDVLVHDLFELPVYAYAPIESRLAALDAVRFEDIVDETYPRQHREIPNEFADLFYLTALRGHRPATSHTAPLTPDEVWATVASGESITTAPGSIPTLAADAIRRIPTLDVPPFVMRLAWRAATEDPVVLLFVEFVRSMYGIERLAA
jgi:DNA-binding transcriptional LysR family regulator